MKDYRRPAFECTVDGSYAAFECSHIGVAGTTRIFVKKTATKRKDFPFKYELRMGIAIMGTVCDPNCYKKSPFDDDWRDNYIGAVGYTVEAAFRVFDRKLHELAESLW